MIVYILAEDGAGDGLGIVGVFGQLEKAKAAAPNGERWDFGTPPAGEHWSRGYTIYEHKVQ